MLAGCSSTFKVKPVWVVNGITLDIVAFFISLLTLSQAVGFFFEDTTLFILTAFVGQCVFRFCIQRLCAEHDACVPSSGLGCWVCNDPRA